MKKEKDKWIEAIAKLTKLTHENVLKWQSGEIPEYLSNLEDERIEAVYITEYKDKNLRAYRKKMKVPYPGVSYFGKKPDFIWNTYSILEIVDPKGASLWVFPHVEGLDNLISAVRFQVSGVKDFIDDLLNE